MPIDDGHKGTPHRGALLASTMSTAMRRVAMVAARPLHTSVAARAGPLPALADEAPKSGGLLSSIFGGGSAPVLPPMNEPLPGVAVPAYTAPSKAPATTQKKLANGVTIAAEETPVRAAPACGARQRRTPAAHVSGAVAGGRAPPRCSLPATRC